uniref:Uncharacterized protein n=1 Tax=Arundo donax TaxID=35708 RepID=A0A0A9E7H3_ARUDO
MTRLTNKKYSLLSQLGCSERHRSHLNRMIRGKMDILDFELN